MLATKERILNSFIIVEMLFPLPLGGQFGSNTITLRKVYSYQLKPLCGALASGGVSNPSTFFFSKASNGNLGMKVSFIYGMTVDWEIRHCAFFFLI